MTDLIRRPVVGDPLDPRALRLAIAAHLNVEPHRIGLQHQTGALRKAVARSIRAYLAAMPASAERLRLLPAPSPAPEPENALPGLPEAAE